MVLFAKDKQIIGLDLILYIYIYIFYIDLYSSQHFFLILFLRFLPISLFPLSFFFILLYFSSILPLSPTQIISQLQSRQYRQNRCPSPKAHPCYRHLHYRIFTGDNYITIITTRIKTSLLSIE